MAAMFANKSHVHIEDQKGDEPRMTLQRGEKISLHVRDNGQPVIATHNLEDQVANTGWDIRLWKRMYEGQYALPTRVRAGDLTE